MGSNNRHRWPRMSAPSFMAIYGALGESARGDIRGSTSSASRLAAGVSALVGAILAVLIAGSCSGAAVATTAPVYSATGVCVAGTPEFAFSFTGFPVGQTTAVSLYLYDGPETTGTQIANVGSTGIETVLWNPRSSDFGPGLTRHRRPHRFVRNQCAESHSRSQLAHHQFVQRDAAPLR